jgi:hypothetical protein
MKNKQTLLKITVMVTTITALFLSNLSLVFAPPTNSFIDLTPNPVGVTQTVKVTYWIDPSPTSAGISAGGWQDITIEVERPDGSLQTIESLTTDSRGVGCIQYTPDAVGTHFFRMAFPGYTSGTVTYTSSSSSRESLAVQEEPVEVDPDYLTTCDIPSDECNWWICVIIVLVIIIIVILGVVFIRRTKKT